MYKHVSIDTENKLPRQCSNTIENVTGTLKAMHLCDIWAAHPMITMLIYECLSAVKSKDSMSTVTIEDYSV